MSRLTLLSAALLLPVTLLAGCGGAEPAPGCDAVATRELAARRALVQIATRGGSREVPGNPDVLITSGGDTARLRSGQGQVVMTTGSEQLAATLANVRVVEQDRRAGSWQCGADLIAVNVTSPGRSLPRLPITYTSETAEDGTHQVFAQVRPDLIQPGGAQGGRR